MYVLRCKLIASVLIEEGLLDKWSGGIIVVIGDDRDNSYKSSVMCLIGPVVKYFGLKWIGGWIIDFIILANGWPTAWIWNLLTIKFLYILFNNI